MSPRKRVLTLLQDSLAVFKSIGTREELAELPAIESALAQLERAPEGALARGGLGAVSFASAPSAEAKAIRIIRAPAGGLYFELSDGRLVECNDPAIHESDEERASRVYQEAAR